MGSRVACSCSALCSTSSGWLKNIARAEIHAIMMLRYYKLVLCKYTWHDMQKHSCLNCGVFVQTDAWNGLLVLCIYETYTLSEGKCAALMDSTE